MTPFEIQNSISNMIFNSIVGKDSMFAQEDEINLMDEHDRAEGEFDPNELSDEEKANIKKAEENEKFNQNQ